jgi:hypothetical protein
MMQYIMKTIQTREKLMGERSATHARIRIPAYLGGPGLEMTRGMPLPAAAFMLYEVPKSNEQFWQTGFRMVMRRDGHALSDWHHLDIGEKAQVMKETICYVPQYLPYKGDTINKNTRFKSFMRKLVTGSEDMESAYEKGSGDCEDLTQAEGMGLEAFIGMQFDERTTHPALREMQEIARNYSAGMVLCSVTSAAVGGANDAEQHLGAHMMDLLIPNHTLKELVSRGDAKVADRLPFDHRYMRTDLPVMEAEGTGIYFSRKNATVGAQVRQDLYKEPCFASMKTPIFHEFGTRSPFYREAMTMFVPDFARRGAGFVGFWFRDARDNMRGVKFEDLENQRPNAQLVPHPEIPADVMAQMQEDVKIRVPPEPLVITGDVTAIEHMTHPEAQRIVDTVSSWNRSSADPRKDIPAAVYTRHNLLDAKSADGIIQTLRRKQGVYKVTYQTEPLMDGESPGLRFLIWDDVARSRPMYVVQDVGRPMPLAVSGDYVETRDQGFMMYQTRSIRSKLGAPAAIPIGVKRGAEEDPGELRRRLEEEAARLGRTYEEMDRAWQLAHVAGVPTPNFNLMTPEIKFMAIKDLDRRSIQAMCNTSVAFMRFCDGRDGGIPVWLRVSMYRYGPLLNTEQADPLTVLRAHAFLFAMIRDPSHYGFLRFRAGTPLPLNYLVFYLSQDERYIEMSLADTIGGDDWGEEESSVAAFLGGFTYSPAVLRRFRSRRGLETRSGVAYSTETEDLGGGDFQLVNPELRFSVNSPNENVARDGRSAFVDFVIKCMTDYDAYLDEESNSYGVQQVRGSMPTNSIDGVESRALSVDATDGINESMLPVGVEYNTPESVARDAQRYLRKGMTLEDAKRQMGVRLGYPTRYPPTPGDTDNATWHAHHDAIWTYVYNAYRQRKKDAVQRRIDNIDMADVKRDGDRLLRMSTQAADSELDVQIYDTHDAYPKAYWGKVRDYVRAKREEANQRKVEEAAARASRGFRENARRYGYDGDMYQYF